MLTLGHHEGRMLGAATRGLRTTTAALNLGKLIVAAVILFLATCRACGPYQE